MGEEGRKLYLGKWLSSSVYLFSFLSTWSLGSTGVLFFLNIFIYLFVLFSAALGLRCCAQAFSGCSERGLLFVVVRGLLIAVASLVAEHGL